MTNRAPRNESSARRPGGENVAGRRHDLDALRAGAMLLGIVYHAALSFAAGLGWMVQDRAQSLGYYVFQFWSHGFRMQLFFLISGFFTAMLWRKRGLRALLWHRFRRIFLPCMLGLITVVPAMKWAVEVAGEFRQKRQAALLAQQTEAGDVWTAIKNGDSAGFARWLEQSTNVDLRHPRFGVTPLTWAALAGREGFARTLLEHGADVNARNRDGGGALHAAAFLGRTNVVALLLEHGADLNARNRRGETALNSARAGWPVTRYIAGLLGLEVDRQRVERGREALIAQLRALGAVEKPAAARGKKGGWQYPDWLLKLMYQPVFILIWFLWFLVWLVTGFAVYAALADRFGWKSPPRRLLLSPGNLLWLVPLTLIPQWFMGESNGGFGPDISMGIIPIPHILFYYALFFGFGALYFDCDDQEGRLGRGWRILLPLATLVVFPLALELATGRLGFRDHLLPAAWRRPVSLVLQAGYAWMMAFGLLGLFRDLLPRENKTIRYISDSSYWLYLAHLPLTIVLQAWMQDWPLPAGIKLALICGVLTAVLLFSYEKLVRYTWLGALLNGPRVRPQTRPALPPASAPVIRLGE